MPPDAVTMPLATSAFGVASSRFMAPRALNEPVTWRHSSFRVTRASVGGGALELGERHDRRLPNPAGDPLARGLDVGDVDHAKLSR